MNLRHELPSDGVIDLQAMLHLMPDEFDFMQHTEFVRGFYSGGCIAFGLALACLFILNFLSQLAAGRKGLSS
jgi:hypothetical protein